MTDFLCKVLLLCFFATRIYEDMVLLKFMRFQQLFRIEELDIYRQNLRSDEYTGERAHWAALLFLVVLMTVSFTLTQIMSADNPQGL